MQPARQQQQPSNTHFKTLFTRLQDKSNLSEEHLPGLEEIVGDENIAKAVLKGARSSMGESLRLELLGHSHDLLWSSSIKGCYHQGEEGWELGH